MIQSCWVGLRIDFRQNYNPKALKVIKLILEKLVSSCCLQFKRSQELHQFCLSAYSFQRALLCTQPYGILLWHLNQWTMLLFIDCTKTSVNLVFTFFSCRLGWCSLLPHFFEPSENKEQTQIKIEGRLLIFSFNELIINYNLTSGWVRNVCANEPPNCEH